MKKLRLALIAVVTLALLGGCSMIEKNSRGWIEDQVASSVERVYPTENLFDLFDKFPDGFKIISYYEYMKEPGKSYSQNIELIGDPTNKTIRGMIKNKKSESNPYRETVLLESNIEYTNKGYILSNEDFKPEDIYFDKFLFQSLTLDKEELSQLKMNSKYHSFENDTISIDYTVKNKLVNKYFKQPSNDSSINMEIYKASENTSTVAATFSSEDLYYTEKVEGE